MLQPHPLYPHASLHPWPPSLLAVNSSPCVCVWGGGYQLDTPGGGGGGGRMPNIRHKRKTPDPLACGQLITVFVCVGGGWGTSSSR